MVHAETLNLMQWNQDSSQKQFVLFLEWQCEAVDDAAQDLEQLCDSVEALGFIDELEKHIVD